MRLGCGFIAARKRFAMVCDICGQDKPIWHMCSTDAICKSCWFSFKGTSPEEFDVWVYESRIRRLYEQRSKIVNDY